MTFWHESEIIRLLRNLKQIVQTNLLLNRWRTYVIFRSFVKLQHAVTPSGVYSKGKCMPYVVDVSSASWIKIEQIQRCNVFFYIIVYLILIQEAPGTQIYILYLIISVGHEGAVGRASDCWSGHGIYFHRVRHHSWLWNIFFGHFLPSTDSSMTVISFCWPRLGWHRKSLVR